MKKKSLDEQIEIAKLKLAFLKENRFYRRMYKPVVVKGCPVIVEVIDPINQKSKEITYEKNPSLILAYSILHFVTILRHSEIPPIYTSGFDTCDYALMNLPCLSENELSTLFDPKKDVNHMSQKMTDVLLDLFKPRYVKGIVQRSCSEIPKVKSIISMDGIAIWFPQHMNRNAYPGPRRRANIATIAWYQVDTFCEGLPNVCFDELRQQPWERRVSVDMSGPKDQIVDEFARFVDHEQKLSKVHPELISRTDSHAIAYRNYTKWQVNSSRNRKEAWMQLKIWQLWKQKQGFKQIARELDLTRDVTAKAFHRAYERIYDTPYNRVDVLENEKSQIEKPDLERFCNNCPYRPYQTCKNPCPEFLELIEMFISQDEVTQIELSVSQISYGAKFNTKQDDGIWCPECMCDGVYTWLDFMSKTKTKEIYKRCPVHKKKYVRCLTNRLI